MIQNVLAASERAAALTRQLLAYSGRGKFVLESVDLSDLIREITALVRMSTPKNAEIVLELADGLPEIQCDPTQGQMQQLADESGHQRRQALEDEPGTVVVTTGATSLSPSETERLRGNFELRPGRYVWLEVRDNGCGMSEETSKKIFDPFFSTKFTGRGLGLSASLCRASSEATKERSKCRALRGGAYLSRLHPGKAPERIDYYRGNHARRTEHRRRPRNQAGHAPRQLLREMRHAIVAYSGGTDSAYLAWAAHRRLALTPLP